MKKTNKNTVQIHLNPSISLINIFVWEANGWSANAKSLVHLTKKNKRFSHFEHVW